VRREQDVNYVKAAIAAQPRHYLDPLRPSRVGGGRDQFGSHRPDSGDGARVSVEAVNGDKRLRVLGRDGALGMDASKLN